MKNKGFYILFSLIAVLFVNQQQVYAQSHPERRNIRAGNRDYEATEYGSSEGDYREALSKNPLSYEAAFNLGDALYKQERYEEAEELWNSLRENPFIDNEQRAKVNYNIGNAQFQQQKLKESAESYAQSLIANPSDLEAKFNLAYVQKLLEEENQDGGGGGNDNNENDSDNDQQNNEGQDGNESQDQSDGSDDQQQGDDPNDGDSGEDKNDNADQNRSDQPDKPEPGEGQPQEAAISKEDADKMLDAIQSQEDKTREKMDEQKRVTVGKSGKNW